MTNFWERVRVQQEAEAAASQPPRRPDGPWWAEGTTLGATAQNPVSMAPGPAQPHIGADGHDYSKANHLKSQASCPECGSGDYMKASQNTSRRCWDCGHNEGREVHDRTLPRAVTMEGPPQMARQTNAGGRMTNNYHPNPADAAMVNG